jgi:hypothetical protein
MKNVTDQKIKLEQKKARVVMEETKLKIKERKMRTRLLIEKGGLIIKAGLDHLPTNALYGALLSIKANLVADNNLVSNWAQRGDEEFKSETKNTTAIILKFDTEPSSNIRELVRTHGLRFNRFRSEWYGNATEIEKLKNSLGDIKYTIEIIDHLK